MSENGNKFGFTIELRRLTSTSKDTIKTLIHHAFLMEDLKVIIDADNQVWLESSVGEYKLTELITQIEKGINVRCEYALSYGDMRSFINCII